MRIRRPRWYPIFQLNSVMFSFNKFVMFSSQSSKLKYCSVHRLFLPFFLFAEALLLLSPPAETSSQIMINAQSLPSGNPYRSSQVRHRLVLVITVNMHAQSLPQSLHINSDSSQILDMFITNLFLWLRWICMRRACRNHFAHHLRFATDSWHVHEKLVTKLFLVIAVNMHARSLPQ
jgi:hypothetical protein